MPISRRTSRFPTSRIVKGLLYTTFVVQVGCSIQAPVTTELPPESSTGSDLIADASTPAQLMGPETLPPIQLVPPSEPLQAQLKVTGKIEAELSPPAEALQAELSLPTEPMEFRWSPPTEPMFLEIDFPDQMPGLPLKLPDGPLSLKLDADSLRVAFEDPPTLAIDWGDAPNLSRFDISVDLSWLFTIVPQFLVLIAVGWLAGGLRAGTMLDPYLPSEWKRQKLKDPQLRRDIYESIGAALLTPAALQLRHGFSILETDFPPLSLQTVGLSFLAAVFAPLTLRILFKIFYEPIKRFRFKGNEAKSKRPSRAPKPGYHWTLNRHFSRRPRRAPDERLIAHIYGSSKMSRVTRQITSHGDPDVEIGLPFRRGDDDSPTILFPYHYAWTIAIRTNSDRTQLSPTETEYFIATMDCFKKWHLRPMPESMSGNGLESDSKSSR
ncbi:hypothetical protein [Synoicihabitans lomoniglobus]|uniref:Uncharacterized protein n=1 Tax=Synoicihabitans lomoniglobus TaxID=2909285 RepID=A0AAE9ZYK7_9BACT|nr:hypothetical protein [Opitutaceae bacterium LMO-M01]WED63598.1 hypothetical protein PXH66_14775 [Opitutaceae bacterium LMO-M01]